jgi:hypothetical protein
VTRLVDLPAERAFLTPKGDRESRSMKMRQLRTLNEFTAAYFREHPDEIDDYLTEIFADFAEDNDTGALLAALRVIVRVRES